MSITVRFGRTKGYDNIIAGSIYGLENVVGTASPAYECIALGAPSRLPGDTAPYDDPISGSAPPTENLTGPGNAQMPNEIP